MLGFGSGYGPRRNKRKGQVVIKDFNPSAMTKQTRAAAMTILSEVARHWEGEAADIVSPEHSDTGALHDAIQCEKFDTGDKIGVNAYLNGDVEKYGLVIHDGRKVPAKMPPVDPIKAWVIRKLGVAPDSKELDGMVYCIRRNIARRGFKSIPRGGLQFFWEPLKQHYKTYYKILAAAIKASYKR